MIVETPSRPDQVLSMDLTGIRRELRNSSHAPGAIYSSDEIFDLEKKRIFFKEWLCVARAEEIADPGDYLAITLIDEPVLLTRNTKGKANCFANVCLHRGVEVASGSGNGRLFSCPYHAWTYDLDGKLVGAGFMREAIGFDAKSCRLRQLACVEWGGWLFVNLDPEAESFESRAREFIDDLDFLRMGDLKIASKIVLDLPTNWKFMVENLLDVYHGRTLHSKTFGKFRSSPEKFPFQHRPRGGTFRTYEAAPMTPDGKSRFGRMPALADRPDSFSVSAHLAPNLHVIARIDQVHPLIMMPTSTSTSRTTIYSLFPEVFFEDPDFVSKAKVYEEFIQEVLEEDSLVVRSLQSASRSRHFIPGRLSPLEDAIHHVLNDYLDRLSGCAVTPEHSST
ncbi:MAG: aromatic ring-hydroxylating dioxygenase subunit alpha [Pseudomonadota bacterium]|nr:aromatic ring-hydroxylating dioxygenase subunit alpha [Pseudomonadota bacterium]